MLVAENGTVDPRRQSDQILSYGRELSFGICQIHCPNHSKLCGSSTRPTRPEFWDPLWQVDTCYDLYKAGVTFYGLRKLQNNSAFNNKIDSLLTFS
jgi:hypothetical protein